MAHVGVQGLGARDGQEDRTQHQEGGEDADAAELDYQFDGILRHQGHQDVGLVGNMEQAERAQGQEPDDRDRPEEARHIGRALRLDHEQGQQDDGRDRHDQVGHRMADARCVLEAFDRAQHRNGRRDDAVAVKQRRPTDAEEKHRRRIFAQGLLRQGHQGQRAAFALVVRPHQEDDVFHGHDHDQGPEDERNQAGDLKLRRNTVLAGVDQGLLHGVQRRRADIAEDDADRADGQRPETFGAVAVHRHRIRVGGLVLCRG